VAPTGQPTKNLVKMGLGPPGERVRPIEPVGHEDSQGSLLPCPAREVRAFEKGVQNSVHETGRVFSSIGLGQQDPLLYGHLGRNLFQKEDFGSGEAKDGSIHYREAIEAPVFQAALKGPIHIGQVILERFQKKLDVRHPPGRHLAALENPREGLADGFPASGTLPPI
jgi:hypothetical protein